MKIIIFIAALLVGFYLFNNSSETKMQASYCKDKGGTMTKRGCVVPMTKEQCESHGGKLNGGQCVKH